MILRYLYKSGLTSPASSYNVSTKLFDTTLFNVLGLEAKSRKEFYSVQAMEKISWDPEPQPKIKNTLRSFITNKAAADLVFSHLVKDLQKDDLLIEIDPGTGILTKQLLQSTNNKLLLFEPTILLLKQLKEKCPGKINNLLVSDMDIHKFYKYFYKYQHNFDLHSLPRFMETLTSSCQESSKTKIVGTICYKTFFHQLVSCYGFQCSLFESANPTLYLFVPFNYYAALFGSPKVVRHPAWRVGIVTKLCFDVSYLGCIEKSSFKICKSDFNKTNNVSDSNKLFLIKLEPKDRQDIKNKLMGKNVSDLLFFINYLIRVNLKCGLIPALEIFIPNCGEEFIKNDIEVCCNPLELNEEKWMKIFQIFTSFPGYEDSVFRNEMNKIGSRFGGLVDE